MKTPLNNFGNLHEPLSKFRRSYKRTFSWNHQASSSFESWKKNVRNIVRENLNYEVPSHSLDARTISKSEYPDFFCERVQFDSAPWFQIPAYFLTPKTGKGPYPTVYLMHEWGGNILFGKERVIQFGNEHPVLVQHQNTYHGGRGLANELTKRGYAVLVADSFYFGERGPRGFSGIPDELDPFKLSKEQCVEFHNQITSTLYLAIRYLMWSGTTWMGVVLNDDLKAIDFLMTRPEVDGNKIACTGLSGGAWRTNFLAAMDDRIKASASVMWMSTNDELHDYNVAGAVGTFCLIPGLWQKIDVPDLSVMAAPSATMVVNGLEDPLFPDAGQKKAEDHIRKGFEWAQHPSKFNCLNVKKPHCFDAEIQDEVFRWFDIHLK